MPDFLRARRDGSRRIRELGFHLLDLASYEYAYLLGPARHDLFFNSGYLPLAGDFLSLPEMRAEAHAAMMYHHVGRSHPDEVGLSQAPRRILDIGCGPGGGLRYLSALTPRAAVCGTERSPAARRLARRNCPQAQIFAPGAPIPGAFDLVTGIGSPTYLGLDHFLAIATPLLAPTGIVSLSGGYRQGRHEAIRNTLLRAADTNGLTLISYRDIAAQTFAALQADIPRREAALSRLPRPLRRYARRWADLPGSPEYAEYETGRRADFSAVLQRAGPAGHP